MNTIDEATTLFRVSLFDGDESFNRYYRAANRDEAVRFASRGYPELDINSCTQMAAGWLNVYHVVRCDGGPEEGGWTYTSGTPMDVPEIGLKATTKVHSSDDPERVAKDIDIAIERGRGESEELDEIVYEERYRVKVEDRPAEYWPAEKPHYQ